MAKLGQVLVVVVVLLSRLSLASLRRDLRLLARILPGEYSNEQQYRSDARSSSNLSSMERHRFLKSRYNSVQLPLLDGSVETFYVEHFMDRAKQPVRQRIYSFHIDRAKKMIKMEIYKVEGTRSILSQETARKILGNLTESDLQRNKACTMFWRRLGRRTFTAATGQDCVANYGEEKVKILVTIVVTPHYIHKQEGWYKLSDGSKVVEIGVPYKLTKVRRYKERIQLGELRKLQRDSPSLQNAYIGPWLLRDFESLLGVLSSGHTVRCAVELEHCRRVAGSDVDRKSFGDYVDVFEYFRNEKTENGGAYIEFSHNKFVHGQRGPVSILREVTVYENSTVFVKISYFIPKSQLVLRQGLWTCDLFHGNRRSESITFITEPHRNVMPVKRYQAFRSLLRKGRQVRMSMDYTQCAGARTKAVSGGEIREYDIIDSETKIEVSFNRLVSKFRGCQNFVRNYVTVIFYLNGNVIVKATTVDSVQYLPYSSSVLYCQLGNTFTVGAVRLFYQ